MTAITLYRIEVFALCIYILILILYDHIIISYFPLFLYVQGDFGSEPWFEHSFEVIVKKSPRRQ